MKRMLDDKIIKWLKETDLSKISELLSNISIVGSNVNIQFLDAGDLRLEADEMTSGKLFINGLSSIVDLDENPLFPFDINEGKVLVVNENEDGLVAKSIMPSFDFTINPSEDQDSSLIYANWFYSTDGGSTWNAIGTTQINIDGIEQIDIAFKCSSVYNYIGYVISGDLGLFYSPKESQTVAQLLFDNNLDTTKYHKVFHFEGGRKSSYSINIRYLASD
jgi:hypothetical protein